MSVIRSALAMALAHLLCMPPASASIWDQPGLRAVPAVFPAEGLDEPGLRALFFEGVPYRGKPTRVFAWYGAPTTGRAPFPAMVLVHGGGGTAFARWVRLWNERGYAAIAMDTYGAVPTASGSQPHAWAGPVGALDTFEQVDEPLEDQWPYHGVAAVLRAHSLLRTFPEIDARRIGVTGVSWGGYLTSMAAGLDERFACAAPVYGCGFFEHDSGGFHDKLQGMGERGRKWAALWDASTVLPNARLPILWLNGTTDHWFPIPAWQRSYRLAPGTRGKALRPTWPHNQSTGESAPEIARFVDSVLGDGAPLPRIVEEQTDGDHLLVRWDPPTPIAEVELNYSPDAGPFEKRRWITRYLSFDSERRSVSVALPPEATVCYVNVVDRDGAVASSDCIERGPTGPSPLANGVRVLLDEDFERRGVGIAPHGVVMSPVADRAKGASIAITDQTAASGSRALRFTDAPGLTFAYFPMREFHLGRDALTQGTATLAFSIRNSKAAPGHLVVEMRDMRKSPHQSGPRLEFAPDGRLLAGGTSVSELPFDAWTHVEVFLNLGNAENPTYSVALTGTDGFRQSFDIPCNPSFAAVSWLAFMMPGDKLGVVDLDDIRFATR
jgi:dienelactone hydrolase